MYISILTNTACNLNCTYCYQKNKKIFKPNVNKICQFIDLKMNEYIIGEDIDFNLIGGETLLYINEIEKIINHIWNICNKLNILNKLNITLNTNGTLIYKNNSIKNLLLKYKNNFKKLGISIDGPKEIHDLNRKYLNGKGSYEDIIKSIEWLKENDFKNLALLTAITNDNLNNFFNVFKFLYEKFKIQIHSCSIYQKIWTEKESIIFLKELIKIIDYIYDNDLEYKDKILRYQIFINDKQLLNNFGYEFNNEHKISCGYCLTNFSSCVDSDGKIYSCQKYLSSGIKKDMSTGYIDNNKIVINKNETIKELNNLINFFPEECNTCDLFNTCHQCNIIIYETDENDPTKYLNKKGLCLFNYATNIAHYYQKIKHITKYGNF